MMTISHWHQNELGPALHCEVAVVGAGIVGCSTAYWLKRENPGQRVALIDAQSPGAGATGRNAGFLLQGAAVDYVTDIERYGEDRAERLWDFTMQNRRLIASELGPDRIALEEGGSLLLAGAPAEDERLQASAERLQMKGEAVTYWTAADVRHRIRGEGFCGGLHVTAGARVNSMKLVREIAGRSGAVILEGHPVFALENVGGRVVLHTSRREVHAERVVLCTNAYLPRLLPETASLIRPIRAQMMATAPVAHWLAYPVYSHEGFYYTRQLASGEMLIGGARHLFAEEEVGYADETTPHLQKALVNYLGKHFPHLSNVSSRTGWSGVMAFTLDGLPIVAEASDVEGCYWAAGFNGHGMGYGFRFGKLLAEMLQAASQTPANVDFLELFDIHRLKK